MTAQEPLLTLRQVLGVCGCDIGSLRRLEDILGDLPPSVRQADGTLRWRLSEVEDWLAQREPSVGGARG